VKRTAILTDYDMEGSGNMDYDVIVIGAGVGGLAAAGVLAAKGLNTLVLEQADTAGGCASSFEAEGYRFDVGACIIEMARVHDWFYQRLGLKREDYITFLPNDPLYELVDILSGDRFTLPASLEGAAEVIGRHSVADSKTFLNFMRNEGKIMDEFVDVMFSTPQGRMRDFLKVFAKYPRILGILKYILNPYSKVLKDLFVHPYTHRLLSNYSVIGGLPPSMQSGMMLWACFAEHQGMFYPLGGMGAVPEAMTRAMEDVGGELRLNTRVTSVLRKRGKACGVLLSDGTTLTSRAVVSNTNANNLYLDMIGEENIPRAVAKGLRSYRMSPSCAIGYLGLDYFPPLKAQHIFALTDLDLVDMFWSDIYNRGIALPQSVGMISCPSFMDPSLAPDGHHALSFITMAPPSPVDNTWEDIKWQYLDIGIEMLDAVYLPGVKDHITFKTIATPEDFEKRLLIPQGSIYSYSMSVLSQMVFRPSNRSKCLKNLYLCGASTHPSGSVPGSICSGLLAADLALEDLNGRRAK
jgi:phytoene desaturase